MSPNPPLLLTTAANLQPLHQTIPPCIIGYLILKRLHILFIIDNRFSLITKMNTFLLELLSKKQKIHNISHLFIKTGLKSKYLHNYFRIVIIKKFSRCYYSCFLFELPLYWERGLVE